jgi:hypothetical protein
MNKLAQLLLIGFLASIVVFSAYWQYSYGSALDPEKPIVLSLEHTGRSMADEFGWRYVQINDLTSDPEYYDYQQTPQVSWNNFLERVNRTLPQNGSVLFATFSKDFLNGMIVEQYWLAERSDSRLVISKIIEPRDRYPMRYTIFGFPLPFITSWKPEITDDTMVLSKPPNEELKGYYIFISIMNYVVFLFVLIVFVVIAGMLGLFAYLAWPEKKKPINEKK